MRRLFTPLAITTAALIATGALGSASADQTATTPAPAVTAAAAPRLVTVNGAADASVPSNSSAAVFTQTYRTQLTAALDDASAKAALVASKEGLTLGPIQSVSEQSNSPTSDCEQQFGPTVESAAGLAAPGAKTTTAKHPKAKKKAKKPTTHAKSSVRSARDAADDTGDDDVYPCDISAGVTVAYTVQ
jgi:hypothetical protein